MAKEQFNREKEHINVGTMGHVDHGKTTTSETLSALSAEHGFSEKIPFDKIDNAKEEKERGITINKSIIKYQTAKRDVAHSDLPGHADYVKNAVTGMGQTDCLILIVDINDGLMPQSKEHLLLARQTGMTPERLIIFVNKEDAADDQDTRDFLVECIHDDLKKLLDKLYGAGSYEKVKDRIIVGSALAAGKALEKSAGDRSEAEKAAIKKIQDLHDAIDSVPMPPREVDKPFLMSVDGVFSISGRGTVVTGKLEQGRIKVGDEVEVITPKKTTKTTVTGVEMFNQSLEEGLAGDNAGLLLRGVNKEDVQSGDVICQPGTISPTKSFKAEVYILTKEEGGRHTHFTKKYCPQFYMRTTNITGTLTSIKAKGKDLDVVMPGDNVELEVELISKTALNKGLKFAIREGGRTIGAGIITEILSGPSTKPQPDQKKSAK